MDTAADIFRYWVRPKYLVVSLPFLIPLAALAVWLLSPPSEEAPLAKRRDAFAAELVQLMPRVKDRDPAALVRAGVILRDGLAGRRDPRRAALWFSEAAERGDAQAGYYLGRLYELGKGVQLDYRRAAEWYRLAAKIGDNADAQFALGELYFKGRGVDNDYREAIDWYLKAAEGGHPGAQAIVGSLFEKGGFIDRDYAKAYKWLSLASRRRAEAMAYRADIDPRKELEDLIPKMSRLELMRGKQKLEAFAVANRH